MLGCMMMEASSPTTSSRSWVIDAPPGVLDVALQLGAERAVIPEAVEAAVDFRRLENEPAPLAERNDLFHQLTGLWFSHKARSVSQRPRMSREPERLSKSVFGKPGNQGRAGVSPALRGRNGAAAGRRDACPTLKVIFQTRSKTPALWRASSRAHSGLFGRKALHIGGWAPPWVSGQACQWDRAPLPRARTGGGTPALVWCCVNE